jgi:hypothetical protein
MTSGGASATAACLRASPAAAPFLLAREFELLALGLLSFCFRLDPIGVCRLSKSDASFNLYRQPQNRATYTGCNVLKLLSNFGVLLKNNTGNILLATIRMKNLKRFFRA